MSRPDMPIEICTKPESRATSFTSIGLCVRLFMLTTFDQSRAYLCCFGILESASSVEYFGAFRACEAFQRCHNCEIKLSINQFVRLQARFVVEAEGQSSAGVTAFGR